MYIVVGLGNPGLKYKGTRHNAGFLAVDFLAKELGAEFRSGNFSALTAEGFADGVKCLLMKPQTFMNNSGSAVAAAAHFYKLPPQNILVISDDISLPPGSLRIRKQGSAGGHNGLKSIISCLGSEAFPRIRIGIGDRSEKDFALADYVLGRFSREDKALVLEAAREAAKAARLIVGGEIEKAMNSYNHGCAFN